jgi:hypothetical protein
MEWCCMRAQRRPISALPRRNGQGRCGSTEDGVWREGGKVLCWPGFDLRSRNHHHVVECMLCRGGDRPRGGRMTCLFFFFFFRDNTPPPPSTNKTGWDEAGTNASPWGQKGYPDHLNGSIGTYFPSTECRSLPLCQLDLSTTRILLFDKTG